MDFRASRATQDKKMSSTHTHTEHMNSMDSTAIRKFPLSLDRCVRVIQLEPRAMSNKVRKVILLPMENRIPNKETMYMDKDTVTIFLDG